MRASLEGRQELAARVRVKACGRSCETESAAAAKRRSTSFFKVAELRVTLIFP
jgi:hypothetical protein